jgi:EAL domain-containing protein (putative c-di-GMP-specific phosphodiesterase class I)
VRGPSGELEAPRALFEAARNLGLIEQLDLSCLDATLRASSQLASHARRHINLLPSTLFGRSPLDLAAIARTHERGTLCLELDAREIVGDPAALRPARAALRELGVLLALDNVAFARNALEALIVLEPDLIKLEMGLVDGVTHHPGQARDLGRLLRVARQLGVDVVAQGVQSEQDKHTLCALGVRGGQGFLWDRPAALEPAA